MTDHPIYRFFTSGGIMRQDVPGGNWTTLDKTEANQLLARCRDVDDQPIAWVFELAKARNTETGEPCNWGKPQLSFTPPNGGFYQRNVRPLYERPVAPADLAIGIMPMRHGGHVDYFVSFRCGDRVATPHVFREQFKAEYHVAFYRWVFGLGDKPDLMAFDADEWPAREYTAEEQQAFPTFSQRPEGENGTVERLATLESFHAEVWGCLVKRGLVSNADVALDGEWRGFVEVIEEHEGEIEACAKRDALHPSPAPSPAHPDDLAVDRFAAAMKAKLAKKREEGRGGWDGPTCNAEILSIMLRKHVRKGDPVDVANFAMMLQQRGEGIV